MRSKSLLGRSLVAALVCALLFQGCGTLFYGASQKVPVTSNPVGAAVFIDGKRSGFAPCVVRLKRKRVQTIRIEKDGYDPAVIKFSRATRPHGAVGMAIFDVLGGAALGYAAGSVVGDALAKSEFPYDPDASRWAVLGVPLGIAVVTPLVIAIDFLNRPQFVMTPSTIDVTLTRTVGQPRTDVIEVDAERLAGLRSIRIGFSDKPGTETLALNNEAV